MDNKIVSKISCIIHACNSEGTLEKALSSAKWVDELIVVDMESTDKTPDIARMFTKNIYLTPRVQRIDGIRNGYIDKAANPWILVLDSDEYLANDAEEIIKGLIAQYGDQYYAFSIPRYNYIAGQVMRVSGRYPDYQVRLFRKGAVIWKDAIHVPPEVRTEKHKVMKLNPPNCLIHHNNYRDLPHRGSIGTVSEIAYGRKDLLPVEERLLRLETIENSLSWKVLQKFLAFFDTVLFPWHSRRRRFFLNIIYSVKKKFFKKDSSEGIQRERARQDIVPDVLSQHSAGSFSPPVSCPLFEDPSVSIIVPVFNNWAFTGRCLNSILEKTDTHIPYEVIVADDGSTDETPDMLKQIAGIKVITKTKNVGFLRNCNIASRLARGKYIIFLKNDTLVSRGWVQNLYDTAERDQAIGLVGAKLLYPDGRLQEAGGIVYTDLSMSAGRFGWRCDPKSYEFNYTREVDCCSGACILVRKDLFDRINGFDEQFAPAYYEDTDLAFTVRKLGYKVVYQPQTEIVHFESKSHSNKVSEEKMDLMMTNKLKFHKKWHKVLISEHVKDRQDLFLSRDRSQHKKILLYIDHKEPTWDRDAGSWVTYEYLKVLSGLGMKVIFWPDDMKNIEPYTGQLQQMGLEIVYGCDDFKEYIRKYGKHIHAVTLSRPHVSIKYIDDIRMHTTAIYSIFAMTFISFGCSAKRV